MFDQFPSDQLVTLVYLVADPATDELVVTNAGHPPPVLLRADGSTEQLPFADGVPLGTLPAGRKQSTVPFRAGDTLLAFTDGLIERRSEDIDLGQDRLLARPRGPGRAGSLRRPGPGGRRGQGPHARRRRGRPGGAAPLA